MTVYVTYDLLSVVNLICCGDMVFGVSMTRRYIYFLECFCNLPSDDEELYALLEEQPLKVRSSEQIIWSRLM